MPIDNRKRKITQDPEIKKIVEETPEEEIKIDEEVAEDIDTSVDDKIEEKIDDKPDDKIEDKVEDKIEKKETPEETPTEKKEEKPIKEKPKAEEEATPSVDYKERYSESSREALTLHFRNKQLVDTIDQASKLPEPTEQELIEFAKSNGTEYEFLDEFNKNLLKRTLINERRFQLINETNLEAKNFQGWIEKVDSFINSPEVVNEFPDIEDNAEEFRKFCLKKDRRGMVLSDLASSFLYGLVSKGKTTTKSESVLLEQKNASKLEDKKPEYTEEDAMRLRTTDPRKYRQLIKAGKFKF